MPGDATFNKEGDGQKLLAPAVHPLTSDYNFGDL